MNKNALTRMAIVAWVAIAAIAAGQVPQKINFQGILTNAGGARQTGTFSVVFAIYDVATGGTPLWSETQTVSASNGLFQVVLGGASVNPNPLPLNLFDSVPRFLGIKVGSDAEMTPRQELTSVPSAFRAQSAVTGVVAGITRINQGRRILVDNPAGPTPTVNVAQNTIDDDDIRDGSLSGSSLGDNSVGNSEISDNAVGSAEIQTDAVGNSEIASNAVGNAEIQNDAVTSPKISTDAVGTRELQANVAFTPNGKVEIGNSNGETVALLTTSTVNGGFLGISSPAATVRNVVSVTDNSAHGGNISVFTDDGGESIRLTQTNTGANASGAIDVRSSNEVPVILIATASNGAPQHGDIRVRNSLGNTRAQVTLNSGAGRVLVLNQSGGSAFDFDGSGPGLQGPQATISGIINIRMDHPLDASKDIYYASLDGPEPGVYVRGTARLVNGQATIQLPEHFSLVASAQGLTVHLTPLSPNSEGLAVASKSTREIIVRELRNGTGTYEFDYLVQAVRGGQEQFQVVRNKDDYLKSMSSTAPEPTSVPAAVDARRP